MSDLYLSSEIFSKMSEYEKKDTIQCLFDMLSEEGVEEEDIRKRLKEDEALEDCLVDEL